MAWARAAWVAWLLRGADELSVPPPLCADLAPHVVAGLAAAVATGSFLVGAPRRPVPGLLAPNLHPPPVADDAVRRQDSRQEPDALTCTSGSVRGRPAMAVPTAKEPHARFEGEGLETGNDAMARGHGRRRETVRDERHCLPLCTAPALHPTATPHEVGRRDARRGGCVRAAAQGAGRGQEPARGGAGDGARARHGAALPRDASTGATEAEAVTAGAGAGAAAA